MYCNSSCVKYGNYFASDMEIMDHILKFWIWYGNSGNEMEFLDDKWKFRKLPFWYGNSGYYQNHKQMKQESENHIQKINYISFSFKIFAAKILPANASYFKFWIWKIKIFRILTDLSSKLLTRLLDVFCPSISVYFF